MDEEIASATIIACFFLKNTSISKRKSSIGVERGSFPSLNFTKNVKDE